jgi:hypothetical protein
MGPGRAKAPTPAPGVDPGKQTARQKDGPKTIKHLKIAGTWVLGVAEKIGVEVAKKALKGALGLWLARIA